MHRTAEIFHAWDEPYAALGLMAALALLAAWVPLRKRPLSRVCFYGLLLGVVLHIAPAFLTVFIALAASELLVRPDRAEMRRWLAVGAVAALVILPWTLRNRVRLGGWIFMRSNLGIELQMSNNDRSGPSSSANHDAGLYRDTHPSVNIAEATRVRDLGELAYNQERMAQAKTWIRTHPRRFAELTLARIRLFWLGWWGDPETAWIFTLASTLSAAGAWLMWRDGHREALRRFAMVWIFYPLTYYLVQHLPRYRVPIWWTVVLSASYAVGRLLGRPAAANHGDSSSDDMSASSSGWHTTAAAGLTS
jgi:hypothetical protein